MTTCIKRGDISTGARPDQLWIDGLHPGGIARLVTNAATHPPRFIDGVRSSRYGCVTGVRSRPPTLSSSRGREAGILR